MSLSSEILEEYSVEIDNWTLIPSSGGLFEITINGELAFSKKGEGRYPETGEVSALIKKAL